jgi:hypothetical protein
MSELDKLELPPGWAGATLAMDGQVVRSPNGSHLVAPVEAKGRYAAGIWTVQGDLVTWIPGYGQLAWAASCLVAVRLEEAGDFDLVVERRDWPSLDTTSAASLPRPSAGVGGFVVAVSPKSRYLAVLLYSGQSEQGYELFALSPEVTHVGGMAYVFGMSDLSPMTFSPDESLVAMALLEEQIWWADPADDDRDWDTPSVGGLVEWATMYVHRIGEPEPSRYCIMVDLPEGWVPPEELAQDSAPRNLRFVGDREVEVGLPWGGSARLNLGDTTDLIVPMGPAR